MANYIGYVLTPRVSSDKIAKVLVPEGGLKAGQVVFCESFAAEIARNLEVYTATQPVTAALGGKHLAVVVNGGFEQLADGRRPAGQPDFTQYEYKQGEIATVIFVDPHLEFEIAVDSTSGGTVANPSTDIGKYLIPADQTNTLAVNASNANIGCSLKICAVRNFPIGGQFGNGFANTYVCIAQ